MPQITGGWGVLWCVLLWYGVSLCMLCCVTGVWCTLNVIDLFNSILFTDVCKRISLLTFNIVGTVCEISFAPRETDPGEKYPRENKNRRQRQYQKSNSVITLPVTPNDTALLIVSSKQRKTTKISDLNTKTMTTQRRDQAMMASRGRT